ncbi:unnamed protein product [Dracunculus medinensis]|uniref:Uncharacterized protein n=1 Tax=Dracunculus medinensis TaxID=318479 RepID=A0A0N4U2A9_DRAME|nr:unnamed protein product [Dracunculus medinensis]
MADCLQRSDGNTIVEEELRYWIRQIFAKWFLQSFFTVRLCHLNKRVHNPFIGPHHVDYGDAFGITIRDGEAVIAQQFPCSFANV